MTVADLFEGSDYDVNPEVADVQVIRVEGVYEEAPMHMQPSVGVPLGGGVMAALNHVWNFDLGPNIAAQLEAATRFGWDVVRRYLDATARAELEGSRVLAPSWDVADAIMLAEVMALAFVQVSGVLIAYSTRDSLMKNRMPVVARQDLADIRAELGLEVRAFLADNAHDMRALFEEEFRRFRPGFDHDYNTLRGRPPERPVKPLDMFFKGAHGKSFSVRQLLDQVLLSAEGADRIEQHVFQVGSADSLGMDRAGGQEPGVPPLVVLEMRDLGLPRPAPDGRPELYGMVNYPGMVKVLGEMAGMARRGEAAAVLARDLPASPEGQLVVSWLRQMVAARGRIESRRAALMLSGAAGWYLEEFPGAGETLDGDAGVVRRVVRSCRRAAAGCAACGAAGAVGGGRGRFRDGIRGGSRRGGRACAAAAVVRALVGELAVLAGGPGRGRSLVRCWGTRRSWGCWAVSGGACLRIVALSW